MYMLIGSPPSKAQEDQSGAIAPEAQTDGDAIPPPKAAIVPEAETDEGDATPPPK